VAARSKAQVCDLALAGIVVSNPTRSMDVCLFCLCCQVGVSAAGRSLVQRSPTDCGPIPRPEESYRLWADPSYRGVLPTVVCVSECDQVKINNLDTYCE
jgi:hypothetical protein